jgi:RNA polymerase sigma factor (TIGR02999 family)
MSDQPSELLRRWSGGDAASLDALMPIVYEELRRMGRRLLAKGMPNPVLQPTVLVHEVWLKLAGKHQLGVTSRPHFFALAGRIMRSILVDHYRQQIAQRRGGSQITVPLNDEAQPESRAAVDLLILNDALDRLASMKSTYAEIIELKFFSGLTNEECAAVLKMSNATVERQWSFARLWLQRELKP